LDDVKIDNNEQITLTQSRRLLGAITAILAALGAVHTQVMVPMVWAEIESKVDHKIADHARIPAHDGSMRSDILNMRLDSLQEDLREIRVELNELKKK